MRGVPVTSQRTRFCLYLAVSFVLIVLAVTFAGASVGRFFETRVLAYEEEHTAAAVRHQAEQHLRPADFVEPLAPAQHAAFRAHLGDLNGVFRVKVFDPSGRIIWSNEPRLIGTRFPDNAYVARAMGGVVTTVLEPPKRSEHVFERSRGYVAEAYVPIVLPGGRSVLGVIETYRDMSATVASIRQAQRSIWGASAAVGLLLYLALGAVVWKAMWNERRAIARLESQNRELAMIQRFTSAVLQPLELRALSTSMVETVGAGLGLARVDFFEIAPDGEPSLVATWPAGGRGAAPAALVMEAVATKRTVQRDAVIALPVTTARGTGHVLAARFAAPISDLGRADVRALEILRDQSAIAIANVELFTETREAHERLTAIVSAIADRMLIVDRDLRVVWMNRVASAERAGADAVGGRCFELFESGPDACASCPVLRVFDSGRIERGVKAQTTADGQVRYLDLVAAPMRDAGGNVYQVLEVARDITDLVEMEERLKQSRARLEASHAALVAKADELERANAALREAQAQLVQHERLAAVGELIVGLHHAILNPLTGILGAFRVLEQEETLQARTRQTLADAEAEVRKIEQLVRRLPSLRRTAGTPYVGGTSMLDFDTAYDDDTQAGR